MLRKICMSILTIVYLSDSISVNKANVYDSFIFRFPIINSTCHIKGHTLNTDILKLFIGFRTMGSIRNCVDFALLSSEIDIVFFFDTNRYYGLG